MKEVKVKDMDIPLIFPLMPLRKMNRWLDAIKQPFREIAAFLNQMLFLTQNGADAHYYDPLTHLSVTMKIYQRNS